MKFEYKHFTEYVESRDDKDIEKVLNRLGRDGWELVSRVVLETPLQPDNVARHTIRAIFKRRIIEKQEEELGDLTPSIMLYYEYGGGVARRSLSDFFIPADQEPCKSCGNNYYHKKDCPAVN